MTMIFDYATKKELKENIGKPLRYEETSIFGEEYKIEDLKPEEHRQIARLQNLKARFENTMNQIAGLQEDAHDLQLAIAKREMDLKNSVKVVEEETKEEVVQ